MDKKVITPDSGYKTFPPLSEWRKSNIFFLLIFMVIVISSIAYWLLREWWWYGKYESLLFGTSAILVVILLLIGLIFKIYELWKKSHDDIKLFNEQKQEMFDHILSSVPKEQKATTEKIIQEEFKRWNYERHKKKFLSFLSTVLLVILIAIWRNSSR